MQIASNPEQIECSISECYISVGIKFKKSIEKMSFIESIMLALKPIVLWFLLLNYYKYIIPFEAFINPIMPEMAKASAEDMAILQFSTQANIVFSVIISGWLFRFSSENISKLVTRTKTTGHNRYTKEDERHMFGTLYLLIAGSMAFAAIYSYGDAALVCLLVSLMIDGTALIWHDNINARREAMIYVKRKASEFKLDPQTLATIKKTGIYSDDIGEYLMTITFFSGGLAFNRLTKKQRKQGKRS